MKGQIWGLERHLRKKKLLESKKNNSKKLGAYISILFILFCDRASTTVFMKFTAKVFISSFKQNNPFLETLYNKLKDDYIFTI